jgi:hypothetical protein
LKQCAGTNSPSAITPAKIEATVRLVSMWLFLLFSFARAP